MTSYVLVIVTSDGCGFCRTFMERHYASLIKELSKINALSIVHYEKDKEGGDGYKIKAVKMGDKLIKNISFPGIIRWFPFFALFKKDDWNNPSKPLEGSVFNGEKNAEKFFEPVKNPVPTTADKLFEFVTSKMIQQQGIQQAPQQEQPPHVAILKNRGHGFATSPVKISYRPTDIDGDNY